VTSLAGLFLSSAALFALVATRVAGFVVVSPFPGQNVSATQRMSLVLALAWIATTIAPAEAVPRSLDLRLLGPAVSELGFGLLIGLAFRLVFSAAEILGSILGQATGLGSPSVLNPTIDAPDTAVGRIVALTGMLVALGAGIHRVVIGALLESFRALPVGSAAVLDAPILALVGVGIDAFVVGVRLSTPVVAVALLAHLALALISRAAPSLQVFSVGFTALFAAGILTIVNGLDDMSAGLATHFQRVMPAIDEVLTAMRR
jgi:flagellar biosynthesis protein FliR